MSVNIYSKPYGVRGNYVSTKSNRYTANASSQDHASCIFYILIEYDKSYIQRINKSQYMHMYTVFTFSSTYKAQFQNVCDTIYLFMFLTS